MELKENSEIIGKLASVETEGDKHKLIFTIMKTIEVSRKAIPVEKLQELQGQRIGIFRIDERYKVWKISK